MLAELFEALNPYEKARFIDARLEWASGGALCGEVHQRICAPMYDGKEDDHGHQ